MMSSNHRSPASTVPSFSSELEDQRLEIENRIRNLFWTISGDYSLDIKPDVDTFASSRPLALYDAIKQGAFADHFDTEVLALYTLKKQTRGADISLLMDLTQLCVDVASYPIVSAERKGIDEIRTRAFTDLLELGKFKGIIGEVRKAIICSYLGREFVVTDTVRLAMEQIDSLANATETDTIIETIDTLYNELVDPAFAKNGGNLDQVLNTTASEILEFQRDMAMSDEMMDAVLKEYLSVMKDEFLRTRSLRRGVRHKLALTANIDYDTVDEPSPDATEKIYAYMEKQFGKSSISRLDQDRLCRKLCTGIHKRCSLYFTKGILSNPAVKNTQFLRTEMQSKKNELYFTMKQQSIRRSVTMLSAMLKQVQLQQLDEDAIRSDYGQIAPARLWKLGRTTDNKLFDDRKKRNDSAFVVDILLDSSSSQMLRQPEIAAQAYIISQALSEAKIAHRVQSFCSYWDYTMIHCFRDYDNLSSANKNILQFRAFGENRDGLAIRTVCDSLKERPEENKLLIILSDGRPNNLGTIRSGSRNPVPYVGDEAVKDTAFEIRKARNQGIHVLGVFVGTEDDLAVEKKIYGKDFAYSRNIKSFAHIVGTYLRKQLEQD